MARPGRVHPASWSPIGHGRTCSATTAGCSAFDDLDAAARRAKEAAGDKDVIVLGAEVARELLRAGLLDEVWIHLVPVLLGSGTPLFDGEQAELAPVGKPVTGTVTHLRFRVANG